MIALHVLHRTSMKRISTFVQQSVIFPLDMVRFNLKSAEPPLVCDEEDIASMGVPYIFGCRMDVANAIEVLY